MMSLAHFEGCQYVSDDYAMDIAASIATIYNDETVTLYYDMYLLCKERGLTNKCKLIVNKLKEYLKNA